MPRAKSERIISSAMWIVIGYAVLKSVFAAAHKAFWYDELCTVAVSGQPNLHALWTALLAAKDSSPPLYSFVEHYSAMLLSNKEIAYRLPSIVAFGCVMWCLFIFVRRYAGSMCALLCAMIPLFTPLYRRYAIEARSYGLVVACIAIALVCYQRVPRRMWVIFLGLALAGAEAFHYYGLFSFVPFFIAELAWTIQRKRIRWGVWAALSAGFLPLLFSWPILTGIRRTYGLNFWGKPSFAVIVHSYDTFFGASISRLVPGIGLMCAVALSLAAIWMSRCWEPRDELAEPRAFDEALVAVGLLGVPFWGFIATILGHGSLTGRYFLSMVLGTAIAVSYVLRPFARKTPLVVAALALLSIGLARQEVTFWRDKDVAKLDMPGASLGTLLSSAGNTNLPLVVPEGQTYVEFAYYAPAEISDRLVGVVDRTDAVVYTGSDSVDRQVAVLPCCLKLRVYEFSVFLAKYPRFLLYSDGSAVDWWPAWLRRDGYLLESVASQENTKIYLVDRSEHSAQVETPTSAASR